MSSPEAARALADLTASVAGSHADRALDASFRALRAGATPIDVIASASRAAALHYDPTLGRAPAGLVALASAANLSAVLEARLRSLPAVQAVALAASEKKAALPARAPVVVSGEITHLGRSFLFAARDGNLPEAEAIFLGILEEGRERRMAGDMLFRAAAEDMGDAGEKLIVAVKLWQLARSLGFRDARTILRPAVQYIAAGARDSGGYRSILAVLGKEWVDLEALASGGRPLDDAARAKLAAGLAAADDASCASKILALLREGFAATSLAEGLSVHAGARLIASRGNDADAALRLAYTHAARFVLTFTRTSEKLYGLFQAALALRSPPAHVDRPDVHDGRGEVELLRAIGEAVEAPQPEEAASLVRTYVARGFTPDRLVGVLADHASRNSAVVNRGLELLMADAGAAEFLATRAPEPAMALAMVVAGSTRDRKAYEAWRRLAVP